MAIAHLPADTGVDAVVAALGADGAVVVDDVASPALLDAVETELRPFLEATPTGPDDFSGALTRRTGALIARSPSSRELVMHPLALRTAQAFLGHATNIQLHLTQAIAIGPGESAQPIHRDQWAFDFFPFPRGYEVQCNTMWALTDFTEENGATRSSATRIGLNLTYNVAWLRQEENQYLSVPRDVAVTLPTELLRLMGYARGAYALGYIDDLRDPIEAVRPGAGSLGFAVADPAGSGAAG